MRIDAQTFEQAISEEHRSHFVISMGWLDQQCAPIVNAWSDAVCAFFRFARVKRKYLRVFIGTSPFEITLTTGKLRYERKDDTIANCFDDCIFLDVGRLLPLSHNLRVACVVEEFVHCYMNVEDESLTSVLVANIWNGVRLANGRYVDVTSTH
jgi:hypothetical protein